MDLLHAELCLRVCECEDTVNTDFDGNSSLVARVAPQLLDILAIVDDTIDETDHVYKEWVKLKTRCYWLNACYYLWRGRLSHNVSELREAELEGLSAIKQAIVCMSFLKGHTVAKIQTPHLVSPKRRGHHWRELSVLSLEAFCNEIQASSILLQSQEQFLEVLSHLDEKEGQHALRDSDREALSAIRETLQARYATSEDSTSSDHSELVVDFLGEHGEMLLSLCYGAHVLGDDAAFCLWFDSVVPTRHINDSRHLLALQRPCIVTILLCCLQTDVDRDQEVLDLLSNMCMVITELGKNARAQLTKGYREISFDSATDTDSDEDYLLDGSGFDTGNAELEAQRSRLRLYSVLLRSLVRKMTLVYSDNIESSDLSPSQRDVVVRVVLHSLHFVSSWFGSIVSRDNEGSDWMEDLRVFHTIQRFYTVILERNCGDLSFTARFTQLYITGLIGIIREQRLALQGLLQARCDRQGRSMRAKAIHGRADLVGAACCDFGVLISSHPFRVVNGEIFPCYVFGSSETTGHLANVAILCESLLWMWRTARCSEPCSGVSGSRVETSFDRVSAERLRVPIGLAIVALCGSACSTRCLFTNDVTALIKIGLEEFCDSDSSALECLSDTGNVEDVEDDLKREPFLRAVGQAVHCIAQVMNSIEEVDAVEFPHAQFYVTKHGPSLPLVATRVLNRLADGLLLNFAEKYNKDSIWADYPFGTRAIGRLLDSLLFKAYKCLHGFSIPSLSDNKESSSGTTFTSVKHKPESTAAATQLYRCIMRAYSQGRKSPPKLALDTVLSALPSLESTPKSKRIHEYLFCTGNSNSSMNGLTVFVTRGPKWEANLSDVSDWVCGMDEPICSDESGAWKVRRGISHLISQGPIPQYLEPGGEDDHRLSTVHLEEELYRKFSCILNCLSLGSTDDYESWYKAAQCLSVKADLIADRLGFSQGFSRGANFTASKRYGPPATLLGIDELLEQQFRESCLHSEGWTEYVGMDLSMVVAVSWSSFESLESFSKQVGEGYGALSGSAPSQGSGGTAELEAWYEIEKMRQRGDYIGWQQAWGSLFVSALRKIAFRCVRLALYILYCRDSPEDHVLVSEVVESLGVHFYTEIMGSQRYGYPMQKMTDYQKRELALVALSCFDTAAVVAANTSEDTTIRPTWDLKLMIGKVRDRSSGIPLVNH
jgi:hypothetical protein